MPGFLKFDRHAEWIIAPMLSSTLWRARQIHRRFFFESVGVNSQDAIVTPGHGDVGREIDRHRHYETFVVVGVLADQINATRRAINARPRAVEMFEGGG